MIGNPQTSGTSDWFANNEALKRQALMDLNSPRLEKAISEFKEITEADPHDYFSFMYLGFAYNRSGAFAKAVKAYDKAIELNPNRFFLYVRRATALEHLGQREKAQLDREAAIRLDAQAAKREIQADAAMEKYLLVRNHLDDLDNNVHEHPQNKAVLKKRADGYAAAQFGEKALQDYCQLIDTNPNRYELYLSRADVYWHLGNRKAAFADVDKALTIHSGDEVLRHRAKMYIANGGVQKALDDLNHISKPTFADYMQLGKLHSEDIWGPNQLKNYPVAIGDYTRALRKQPRSVDAFNKRAYVFKQMRQPDKAIDDLSQALAIDTKDAHLYEQRGLLLVDNNKNDNAVADFTKAIALNPSNSSVYAYRAQVYERLHLDDKAIDDYSKAIDIVKTQPHYFVRRAALYQRLGSYAKAIADYSMAADLYPGDTSVYIARAALYEKMANYELSLNDYHTVLKINPQDGQTFSKLVALLEKLKRWQEVISLCTDFEKRVPDDGRALYYRSRSLDALGKHGEAKLDRQKLLFVKGPTGLMKGQSLDTVPPGARLDPDYLLLKCWHALDLGDNEKALDYVNQSIAANPKQDLHAYLLKAEAEERLGHENQASQSLQKAVELGANLQISQLQWR